MGTKHFSTAGIASTNYLAWYYFGAFIAALACQLIATKEEICKLEVKHIAGGTLLAAVIYSAFFLVYWAYAVAPLILVQPFLQAISIFTPMLAGLFIFKEKELFSKKEFYGLGTSSMGVLILICALLVS